MSGFTELRRMKGDASGGRVLSNLVIIPTRIYAVSPIQAPAPRP